MRERATLAALCCLLAFGAAAKPVTLVARGTGFVISGELLEFDGARYVIASPVGRLAVPAAEVECSGPGCPTAEARDGPGSRRGAALIAGGGEFGMEIASGLIEAMAFEAGGVAVRSEEADGRILYEAPAPGGGAATFALSGAAEANPAVALTLAREPEGETLALDAMAFIVSAASPVSRLNAEAARRAFTGEVSDWSALGEPGGRIALHVPAHGPAAKAFEEMVLNGAAPAVGMVRHGSLRALADAVARDPAALGFSSLAFEGSARALPLDTPCGIEAAPTRFAVKTGDYPFTLRLGAVAADQPPGAARALLDFAASDAAQAEIEARGGVDGRIESLPLNAQGRRIAEGFLKARAPAAAALMAEFAAMIVAAERLSVTLRFPEGAEAPTPSGSAALRRLAQAHAAGAVGGREILLVGFADDGGGFAGGVTLSVRRAAEAAEALRGAFRDIGSPPPRIVTAGYGPLAPVTCPGAGGRRVEIWTR